MIKTIIDFLKESKEASQERLKLPIVPFYIFLLIVSYWKPISIYLLSEKNIEGKIKEIDFLYKNNNHWDHILNLLILLFISTISSILFPFLMFLIEYLLKKPNKERKIIKNKTKDIDREEELKIAMHKFDMNKILSGNKEVEDYNQSIEDLKKSYEDRIQNMEIINTQKDKNLESQIDLITKDNLSLTLKIDEINKSNISLNNLISQYRLNEFDYTDYPRFNIIFENKNLFKNYINSLGLVADTGVFISSFFQQIIDYNLHSLLNRIAICVYTDNQSLKLNKIKIKYDEEKKFIIGNNIGELIVEEDITEIYSITKSFHFIKGAVKYAEDFKL